MTVQVLCLWRILSSGMSRRLGLPTFLRNFLPPSSTPLAACLAYSSNLKMEAVGSCETQVIFCTTSRPRRSYSSASQLMILSDKNRFRVCLSEFVNEYSYQDQARLQNPKERIWNNYVCIPTPFNATCTTPKYVYCSITARTFWWRDFNYSAKLVPLIYSTHSKSASHTNRCVCIRACFILIRVTLLERQCVTVHLFDRTWCQRSSRSVCFIVSSLHENLASEFPQWNFHHHTGVIPRRSLEVTLYCSAAHRHVYL
jgi:hypothetical protein